MNTEDIIREERGKFKMAAPDVNTVSTIITGRYLTMRDGSEWFHGDGGQGPFQTEPPTKGNLNVYT
jgi:hypothetical protein